MVEKEVPSSSVSIGALRDEHDIFAKIVAVCKELLPGWDQVADASIEISIVSGGISNALYKVSICDDAAPPTHLGNPVAFRVYGDNTEKFIDRDRELGIMQLVRSHGFGPELLATFADGRIESFLPMRCLTPEEISNEAFVPGIAAALAEFHAIEPATSSSSSSASGNGNSKEHANTPFGRIREWLSIVRGLDFSDDCEKASAIANFDLDELERQVALVERAAKGADSPVVFAHNDLLSGNIMISDAVLTTNNNDDDANHTTTMATSSSSPPNQAERGGAAKAQRCLTFIDFEYADVAPRGFDWGNHFCEYAGFECDYTRYPNEEAAGRFVRAYLAAATGKTTDCVPEDDVKRGVAEANVFALASHQYWGTWALMQARWSQIEFDYMGYATLRWGEYERRKEEFLEGAAKTFSRSPSSIKCK